MLINLFGAEIQPVLRGPILTDETAIPRYWASVWTSYSTSDLAPSTQLKRLRYIESFYQFTETLVGKNALDDAISEVNLDVLSKVLDGFFISIKNRPVLKESAQIQWQTAFEFVQSMVQRQSTSNLPLAKLNELNSRITRLNILYQQLRIGRRKTQETIRSLPACVIEALYELLDPTSTSNPFRNDATKWRVFILFLILLHQGLRRGEALILPVDAVKTGFEPKTRKNRNWLNVVTSENSIDDTRYNRPSIKNHHSIRRLPVSDLTRNLIQEYTQGHRGKPNHAFLLNSQHNKPLSAESVNKIFIKISRTLPSNVMQSLKDRTGKDSITPHDLRHTCAVIRLNQLLVQGDSMDEALQKLRTFFGWSRSSDMPRKYARAIFEDRLAGVWNNVLDDRVALLRAIPRDR